MTETTTPKRGVPIWAQILIWVILAGLLALVGFGLQRAQNPMAVTGKPVPDFDLVFYEGYQYNTTPQMKLSDLRGKIVMINIWASWCKPCEQEAPELEQAWQFYKDGGDVVFIGVDWVDTEKEALAYIDEFDITYLNGPDIGTRIAQAYNIQGVPETFYVAKNGELRGVHIGPLKSPQLDEKIEELLAEQYP